MKKYFVRYTEGHSDLLITDTPTYKVRTSFNAGTYRHRNGGHRRKADAIAWCKKINDALGREVAFYDGAFDV